MGCCGGNSNRGPVVPTAAQFFHGVAAVSSLVKKENRTPKEEVAPRLDQCRACERATKHPTLGLTNRSQCVECSCIILAKARVKKEVCPLGKWKVLE